MGADAYPIPSATALKPSALERNETGWASLQPAAANAVVSSSREPTNPMLIKSEGAEVAADMRLGDLFDSVGVTEVVLTVEEKFGFAIPDEVLWPDLLDASIEGIAAYIDGRLPRPLLTAPSAG